MVSSMSAAGSTSDRPSCDTPTSRAPRRNEPYEHNHDERNSMPW